MPGSCDRLNFDCGALKTAGRIKKGLDFSTPPLHKTKGPWAAVLPTVPRFLLFDIAQSVMGVRAGRPADVDPPPPILISFPLQKVIHCSCLLFHFLFSVSINRNSAILSSYFFIFSHLTVIIVILENHCKGSNWRRPAERRHTRRSDPGRGCC